MTKMPNAGTASRTVADGKDAVRSLDSLAYRLLAEVRYGRDAVRLPTFLLPGVTLAALAVYRTNPQRN